MERTFDTKTIRLVAAFEDITKAPTKDCFVDSITNTAYFIVDEGKIGLAIGRNGECVKHAEKVLKMNVKVYEFSSDLATFVKNIIPYVRNVNLKNNGNGTMVELNVERSHKAVVIGRDGKNIEFYRKIIMRNHGVSGVMVR